MVLFERAKELTEFCLEHGGKAFQGYQIPVLFQYAFFHLSARTAFVVRRNGEISAAMFCWAAPETEIRARAEAGQSTFQWRTSADEAGASLFVAEVVKRSDCNAKTLAKLFRQAMSRWPDWQQKKIFTFRNGFLVELEPDAIARLMNGGTNGR